MVNGSFVSGGLQLSRYLARPAGRHDALPGLILCHGFPIGPLDARQSAITFPELIDRIANELGWAAMTFNFRGCGTSEGDFSLQGWVDDLRAAIAHLIEQANPTGIWIVGTNTGGSIAICAAADDPRVRGAALLGAAPTSRTGRHSRGGSSSTLVTSGRCARPVTRRRSTSGPASCAASGRCTRRAGSPRARSS